MANWTEEKYQSFSEYKAGIFVWKTVPPILITFGTIGNILSIIVLTRKSIRKSTTALFLTFLTFSDLMVLYTGLLRQWVRFLFGYDLRHISGAFCKIHIWLVYSSLDFSAWIIIALTLERVIAVWCPHSAKTRCTRHNATVLIVTLLILILGLNAHLLYGMVIKVNDDTNEQTCGSVNENYSIFFRSVWSWLDLCVYCLIPFIVIVSGNSLILYKVLKRRRKAKPKYKGCTQIHGNIRQQRNDHQSSMTAMLFTLNTVFLFTTLPISIYDIGYKYWHSTDDPRFKATLELWWALVNMLMYLNNSLNFLLYSLSGSRFRQEFKRIICQGNSSEETRFHAVVGKARVPVTDHTEEKIHLHRTVNTLQEPDVQRNEESEV